jgi:hypothetical protein
MLGGLGSLLGPAASQGDASLLVRLLPVDWSGKGGPTDSKSYLRHSSTVHGSTQAPPPREGGDAWGDLCAYVHVCMSMLHEGGKGCFRNTMEIFTHVHIFTYIYFRKYVYIST